MTQPLWTPSAARVQAAQLTRFMKQVEGHHQVALPDYDTLWQWSVDHPELFWPEVIDYAGLQFTTPWHTVLGGEGMEHAKWFEGATLNFAENLLRHRSDKTALISIDERDEAPIRVSYNELAAMVAKVQAQLLEAGVGQGDRVAAWMPNRIETVVTMLAASSIGAIFSSSSPDFGIKGVMDRFGQIQPKVLLCTTASRYNGRDHDMVGKLAEIIGNLQDSLTQVLVVQHTPGASFEGLPLAVSWSDVMARHESEPTFAPLPFDHPLYIMYSSGTTGVPKCIVHGAGGTLVQHAKEHILHTDLSEGDTLFYFTTCGWMMWNWLVSGLLVGAEVVLWDGSPAVPSLDVLWRRAGELGINVFGTSPKFLSMCEKEGLRPGTTHDLSQLKAVLSTGSPLSVDNFNYVYEHISRDVQLASISGGTDIISCFMLGCPIAPVYPGEIQKRGLGMAVEAWRSEGEPVVGEKAELVCTRPFPSMPVGFWSDTDGARYHNAYFAEFDGVWRHGDFIEITEHQGVIVHGRSDSTLNPGGVRIGTAEIYRPVESMDEVREALVVGLPTDDNDVEVVLFVVLQADHTLDDELTNRMKRRIRSLASPRHVPARILQVPAVPRTISGKKVEIAVSRVLQDMKAPNRDALGNPEALDWFESHKDTLRR